MRIHLTARLFTEFRYFMITRRDFWLKNARERLMDTFLSAQTLITQAYGG